ncbi:MAG TPA: EscU/YscU/HrcU family type III secretion system export apparatus switch protein, partial [Gammaproteobacteria bacterium]|nr:EscU/YscU/HrcU family type III secretion system export apparatus switch protein [Gammaproteobacteria bacterium]
KDGKVARSADFTGVFVMLAAGAALFLTRDLVIARLQTFLLASIDLAASDPGAVGVATVLVLGLQTLGMALGPILLTGFVAALVVAYLQVGPLFTVKPLIPDSKRLNAAEGFKRLFGKDRLVDLVKNVARLGVMIAIGWSAYEASLPQMLQTMGRAPDRAMSVIGSTGVTMASSLLLGLGVLAIADLLLQRHRYERDQRMTKHEVTQEYKEAEGNPEVKAERRRLHHELLRGSGIEDVEHADVLVVNPTHVAVALQYRAEEMNAPRVLARGRGEVAAELRQRARRHRIPIVRDVTLARSLVELELDDEIPDDLFEAVAEVLHFVYSLRS